jgi:hypothetical protein
LFAQDKDKDEDKDEDEDEDEDERWWPMMDAGTSTAITTATTATAARPTHSSL